MEKEPRIVIRRPRVAHAPHHGGSWKIAYADFMTAMMAFFLIMWLLLLVPKKNLQGIAQYFRTPLMSALDGKPNDATPHNIIPGGSPSAIPNHVPTDAPAHPITQPQFDTGNKQEEQKLEDLKRRLEALINSNPVLKKYRPQLVLDMTPEGLRIQILDAQNKPMFALGSATLSPAMIDILHALAPTLNEMPNGLSIAGHTDATQYAGGLDHYSNWELSADRANAARQALVVGGIGEDKVRRILGLGSTLDLVKNDPMAPANRRISIVVLNHQAEQMLRATYSGAPEYAKTLIDQAKAKPSGSDAANPTAPGGALPAAGPAAHVDGVSPPQAGTRPESPNPSKPPPGKTVTQTLSRADRTGLAHRHGRG